MPSYTLTACNKHRRKHAPLTCSERTASMLAQLQHVILDYRFGDLPAAAREEEKARVYLPLDEYVAQHLSPVSGLKTKKPRPRKVNGIRAVNLQAALLGAD